jgi:hypothetical protein
MAKNMRSIVRARKLIKPRQQRTDLLGRSFLQLPVKLPEAVA